MLETALRARSDPPQRSTDVQQRGWEQPRGGNGLETQRSRSSLEALDVGSHEQRGSGLGTQQ